MATTTACGGNGGAIEIDPNYTTIKQRRKFALLEGKELKQKEIFGK